MSQYQTRERSKGTIQFWEMLARNVTPEARSVLDIGCNEGVFSRNLADCGLFVTGFDLNYKAIINGLDIKLAGFSENCLLGHYSLPPEQVESLPEYDVVLLLSVHHQWWANLGPETANRMLLGVARKARRQFFFVPACIAAKYGAESMPFADNDYAAVEQYFRGLLESIPGKKLHLLGTGANELPPSEPLRPLYVLQDAGLPAPGNASGLVPQGLEILGSRSRILDVEMSRCVDFLNFTYAKPGWHAFVACLEEHAREPGIDYRGSVLRRFYESFRPASLQEAFGVDAGEGCQLKNMPVNVYNPLLPWSWPDKNVSAKDGNLTVNFVPIPPHDFHRCGPMTEEAGAREMARLVRAYEGLRDNGYRPELHVDGYIRGILFRDGDDYCFQVTGGQHRLAALAALGCPTLRVKLQPGRRSIVDRNEIPEWPWVRAGLYSPSEAITIFRSRFERNGGHARRLIEAAG